MAHLPEPIDELDAALVAGDPVVRAPKVLVSLPDPPAYATRTVLGICIVALLIGGSLGAVGIGIVYATHVPSAYAAGDRRPRAVPGATIPDAAVPTFSLAPTADGGLVRTVPEITGPAARYVSRHQRLGRGRTLPMALRALGLPNDLATRVVRSLRPLLNMHSLQPSDEVVVQRDPLSNNELRRVEYRRSDTQVWAVSVEADSTCTAERVEVTRSTERVVTGFVVGDSLQIALERARLQPDIVARLEEVFTALDLGRQLRRGDAVRLIVEEERLNGVFFRYGRLEAIDYRGAMGRRRGFFHRTGPHSGEFYDAQGLSPERGPLHAPVSPVRITSPFNLRRMHPVLHVIKPHLGTDFGAGMGTPVYAAAEGTVLSVGSGGPTGNLVRLAHPALGIETGYAHLSRFAPGLRGGQHVRLRQLVGYVGSTGRSTGPHLHFSCKRGGNFFDCQTLFQARRVIPATARAEFDQDVARLSAELSALPLEGEAANGGLPPTPPESTDAGVPAATEEPVVEENAPTE